jgi:hypothetical protein
MSDPVTEYQDAFARLEEAERALYGFRKMLYDTTEALKRPQGITISGRAPISARAATGYNNKILNLETWPDSNRVTAMIVEWQSARDALETAWTTVPKDRQLSLISPEKAAGGRENSRYRY